MEAGLIYRALRDGVIEVAMGYSTDARIVALDLVNLVDDKAFSQPTIRPRSCGARCWRLRREPPIGLSQTWRTLSAP